MRQPFKLLEPILKSEEVCFKKSNFGSPKIALNRHYTLFVQIDESSQNEYCLLLENHEQGVIVTWNKVKLQSMKNAIAHAKQLAGFYIEKELFHKLDRLFYAQENVAIEQLEIRKEDEAEQEESFKALESLLVEDCDELTEEKNSQQVEKSVATQASPTTSEALEIQPSVKSSFEPKPIRLANIAKFSFAIAALISITYFVVGFIVPANVPSPERKQPAVRKIETQ
ncbi:MAG: hypothetical protein WBA41_17835 [Rivularia sp. (in: cyanobacteria)]